MNAMRKKAAALLGAGVLTLGLAACGDADAGDVVDEATAEVSEAADEAEDAIDDAVDELDEQHDENADDGE
ncbi:hypothetical protein [Demequina activiva]|uniref:Uncharacterized protein n=1 Tax=Demequina activiva TaxID=1582364 RepID=A0A919PZV2_9MICO|nr:hypothetical protein [Demequina activiva]GIG53497.1 hypothetical protein Dac01nite_02490 [Demequina activiva]